ncbi:MAG: hypothetical protein HDQ98_11600 [Lachnospiraceae bacterium]|nr:hypothetical protein [Lachnospiraceae bacterium]
MGRNRKAGREHKSALGVIEKNSQTIAENTEHINEKLDDIKSDVGKIQESTASKLPVIIAVITLLVTISGVSVAGIWNGWNSKTGSEAETVESESEPEYKIYLYSEYSKFNIDMEVDMTASLNFEADAVSITAHLASGGEDTVQLDRKNATEWQKKVEFTETGIHEVVVTATAPNGEVIENSIEVEVTPVSIDMDIFNQLLNL